MIVQPTIPSSKPDLISLFCGPGGLDEGFRQAGFRTRLAYDSAYHCVVTHRRNHPEADALQADLGSIAASEIIAMWDRRSPHHPVGMLGGPPCQAFSFANVHKRDDDHRARLVWRYAQIIGELKKKLRLSFFVFENVTGLLGPKHKQWFDQFKEAVTAAGFDVQDARLNALDFSVPQHRERIFVIGINREVHPGVAFSFPCGDSSVRQDVKSAIGTLTGPTVFSRAAIPSEFQHHPNHWCMRPRSARFSDGSIIPGDSSTSRSFRALAWDRHSFTVAYGNREVHVHPECKRRLSVYEAMLLQGFPSNYVLDGNLGQQFSMVSDAVAPPVAKAIAAALIEQLGIGGTNSAGSITGI